MSDKQNASTAAEKEPKRANVERNDKCRGRPSEEAEIAAASSVEAKGKRSSFKNENSENERVGSPGGARFFVVLLGE